MAITPEDRQFLKQVYQNLNPNKPLSPGDPFYQPLYEMLECDDPVELLETHIEFSGNESRQFFSGFRGSGKTTELLRLKKRMEENGHLVFYADVLQYINPAQAIDITDLLIVIAGAFSDAVEKAFPGIDKRAESYWQRFWNYLTTTTVHVEELKLTPVKDVAELKLALKDTPSFRQKLQESMSNRLYELEAQVKKFFEDYVKELRKQYPGRQVVFLVDQLEQVRGSLFNEREVISSVERLFSLHSSRLDLPYIHVIYTVPPWLKFVYPAAQVVILHSVRQWEKDFERTPCGQGGDCLLELVKKRFGPTGLVRFFGDESRAHLFIGLCGGHFRDLLRLFLESILRAKQLPVTDEVIKTSIIAVRTSFLPIAAEDAIWLQSISESRASGLINTSPESVARFTRFLDTHFVLYLRNGEEWYDIHPLIRDEVRDTSKNRLESVKLPSAR